MLTSLYSWFLVLSKVLFGFSHQQLFYILSGKVEQTAYGFYISDHMSQLAISQCNY